MIGKGLSVQQTNKQKLKLWLKINPFSTDFSQLYPDTVRKRNFEVNMP